ncbi:CBS domain-containing protein [Pontibacter sp. G13]|uniref:CBS domain-containing protein n=1 Tax=Pontibacter sp. G13 TaxID=3074898 RepID=UPI0028896A93|nr:CBS domain-containing protein [Pontibacter sp. G13]WNJ19858.1 CBS domain-containing protein [Pontibacter sp. G13]
MITVKHILAKKGPGVWTVLPTQTVYEALQVMAEHNVGCLPVVDKDGKLAGMFSERDYARKVILKGKASKETLVEELMTRQVYFVKPTRTVQDCMMLFSVKKIRHLPVMFNGELQGLISIGDAVNSIISEQADQIESLERYISSGGYG